MPGAQMPTGPKIPLNGSIRQTIANFTNPVAPAAPPHQALMNAFGGR